MNKSNQRSPWPYAIIGSFILLAIFDAGIVTLALQSRTGTIEENPYDSSLRFEDEIEATRAVKRDKLRTEIGSVNGKIAVDISGLPKDQEMQVTLSFLRADQPALDQIEKISSNGPSFNYSSGILKNGLWLVSVTLRSVTLSYKIGPKKVVVQSAPGPALLQTQEAQE